jgi:hypothetical protein
MRVPPNIQITSILEFLRVALRSDSELLTALQAEPNEIVRGLWEDTPIYEEANDLKIYPGVETPCLACVALDGIPHTAAGPQGQQETLTLWYVVTTPMGDIDSRSGRAVTGPVKVRRWVTSIWWRLSYWLRRTRYEAGAVGDAYRDLMEFGGIHKLRPIKVQYFPSAKFSGFSATLEMVYYAPPYLERAPRELEHINLDMDTAEATGQTTLEVEGDIDVT